MVFAPQLQSLLYGEKKYWWCPLLQNGQTEAQEGSSDSL